MLFLGPMESGPAMVSVESLRLTTETSSLASSRASSRSPTKLNSKRKFSLAARMRSASELSLRRDKKPSRPRAPTSEELSELMGKIPNVQNVKDNKTFRERAQKQLQGIEADHIHQVLEEYTRIPHTLLPNEMLQIKLETRIAVRDSVAKARAVLIARVNAENEEEDRLQELRSKLKKPELAKIRVVIKDVENSSDSSDGNNESPVTASTTPELSFLDDASDLEEGREGQAEKTKHAVDATNSEQTSVIATPHESATADTSLDPTTTAKVKRILEETEAAGASAPITKVEKNTPDPPGSRNNTAQLSQRRSSPTDTMKRVGSREPSRDNPFASFLTEKSDAEAEKLPKDLMLCYFAHNQVQDRLRAIWRQKKKSTTAEQVAQEVWEQLPEKVYTVSQEFEGQMVKRTLNMEQMVYVWVQRFWQRAKDNGW